MPLNRCYCTGCIIFREHAIIARRLPAKGGRLSSRPRLGFMFVCSTKQHNTTRGRRQCKRHTSSHATHSCGACMPRSIPFFVRLAEMSRAASLVSYLPRCPTRKLLLWDMLCTYVSCGLQRRCFCILSELRLFTRATSCISASVCLSVRNV